MASETQQLVAVSDAEGAVGVFRSIREAAAATEKYRGVPMVATLWPRTGPPPPEDGEDVVWGLPYKDNGVLALVSDDRAAVEAAQRALLPLDLVHDDSLDYWEMEVGRIIPAALNRLEEEASPPSEGGLVSLPGCVVPEPFPKISETI